MKCCGKCQCIKPADEFDVRTSSRDGLQSWCKECKASYHVERGEADPWGWWRASALSNARRRAKKYGVPFALTLEFLESIHTTVCPVSGWDLVPCNRGRVADNSPSIDRTDPAKGYVPGNVFIVAHQVNRMKNDGSPSLLRKIADWVESKTPFEPLPA